MPSKLDDYLNNASNEQRDALNEVGKTIDDNVNSVENSNTNNIEPPAAKPAEQVNMNQPKLDEKTAEHIQNVNEGQGNNYLNESPETTDSLAKYPAKEQGETEQGGQSLEKDNEQER